MKNKKSEHEAKNQTEELVTDNIIESKKSEEKHNQHWETSYMGSYISGKPDDEDSFTKVNADHPFVKHEWEEFIAKLCSLDDPKLKKFGYEELEKVRAQKRGV